MASVAEMFGDYARELGKNSIHAERISAENVFQAANLKNREIINRIMAQLVLPGSAIVNEDILVKLGELSRAGKSCLILMEHYSNFDLPVFFHMMERKESRCREVASQLIAMAGMKLNEETLFVRGFTEAYSRIVIYPSRSIAKLDPGAHNFADESGRARAINRAALHCMVRRKHEGHVILVFPSGTRYRPGEPETKRGLREMDSYIKSFDHLLFIGMAGNTLRIADGGSDMAADEPARDFVVYYCDKEIVDSRTFRDAVRCGPQDTDPKQAVADAIMAHLEQLHTLALEYRAKHGGLC